MLKKRIVLIGGGHTHAIALRMWAMAPRHDTEIILVSPVNMAAYSGMLPGHVAGHYSEAEMHMDLRRLANAAGAMFIEAAAEGLNLASRTIILKSRPPLTFDLASINVGGSPLLGVVPGAENWAIPIKPVPRFLAHWRDLIKNAQQLPPHQQLRIILVGGGAGGVELALSMRHRLGPTAEITVVHSGNTLLSSHNRRVQKILTAELHRKSIKVITGDAAALVSQKSLTLSSGLELPFDTIYWTTQAQAPRWFSTTGLELTAQGYLAVDKSLQSMNAAGIFAAGDCATVIGQERPRSGVFAVRQAAPLFQNLKLALDGKALKKVHLQREFLSLIGLGDHRAVAARGKWATSGQWNSQYIWRLKDRIDQRFMAKFSDLAATPDMTAQQPSAAEPEPMRCFGCGSKVGASVLTSALEELAANFPDVVKNQSLTWGLNEREDVSQWIPPPGLPVLQSIDYLPALVSDPFSAGQITCNHAVNDILAKAGEVHNVLLLAVLPVSKPHISADHLRLLLAGVATQLRHFGAFLAGGHTAEGERLAVGIVANGIQRGTSLSKAGGKPGDALILTKALGTGVIFAGAQRGLAPAPAISNAIASMVQSQHSLGPLLRRLEVHACTDVTGFGLLGHLAEMLRGETMRAIINRSSLPYLEGAHALADLGIRSSLFDSNYQITTQVRSNGLSLSEWALLCDPQTSGGFLISVAPDAADDLVTQLRDCGLKHATIIGRLAERGPMHAAIEIQPPELAS